MSPSEVLPAISQPTQPARTRKWRIAIAFLALLALIAKPVWDGREQFQWGEGVDDGIYWVTAKALATGQGYRLINLPGQPFQTKYPPLYPFFLSLAWRIQPDFPRNFVIASALQAALIAIYLAALMLVLRQLRLSFRRITLICALTLVTFQFVLLGNSLFSELLSGCFTLFAIALLENSRSRARISAAGICAGLAYLGRTAAIPLFVAVPVFLLLRKRTRDSIFYFATLAPIALGWHAWVWLHAQDGSGGYIQEYLRVIRVTGFWANLVKQFSAISTAAAENLIPGITAFLMGIPLHHLVLAAAIAGGIRLAYRRAWPLAMIFAAVHLVMIACWWFEGVFRLMAPVWPFLLAGISEELNHVVELASAAKGRILSQKLRWLLTGFAVLILLRNDRDVSSRIDQVMRQARAERVADLEAYRWIAANARANDVVLSWKDSVSYLYTGVPASHPLFVAFTPQSAAIKALEHPASPPPNYSDGLLLVLQSDLSESFAGHIDGFRVVAETIPGARLQYESPTALIYRFPLH